MSPEDFDRKFRLEVNKEVREIYRIKYGKRNPNTLSQMELDAVNHEALIRVQDRRKGRLVP